MHSPGATCVFFTGKTTDVNFTSPGRRRLAAGLGGEGGTGGGAYELLTHVIETLHQQLSSPSASLNTYIHIYIYRYIDIYSLFLLWLVPPPPPSLTEQVRGYANYRDGGIETLGDTDTPPLSFLLPTHETETLFHPPAIKASIFLIGVIH